MTSYLFENEAENLQNGNIHLAQIPHFGKGYLENHLGHIEVSDGYFFAVSTLSFELKLFFDQRSSLR